MIDLRKESDLWWSHGVIIGEEELELEDSACNCKYTNDNGEDAPYPRMAIATAHVSLHQSSGDCLRAAPR